MWMMFGTRKHFRGNKLCGALKFAYDVTYDKQHQRNVSAQRFAKNLLSAKQLRVFFFFKPNTMFSLQSVKVFRLLPFILMLLVAVF